jgi:hypothetical protein
VKSCLDEFNTCEPAQRSRIGLELEAQSLENELFKKQIPLLEMSQAHRCCPGEEGQPGRTMGEGTTPRSRRQAGSTPWPARLAPIIP